jgi:hypothetical protein
MPTGSDYVAGPVAVFRAYPAFGAVLSEPGVILCSMLVTVRIDGLGELLDQQFSVASRGQLLSLGMKDTALQWRIRAGGPWQALLPACTWG